MIFRLAARSLLVHPVRSAVLAFGFGVGVAVMATLLGVGEVILEQARAPALVGGGDVRVSSATGALSPARFVLSSLLGSTPLQQQVAVASPTRRAHLFLVRTDRVVPISVRAGIPSAERALHDPETAGVAAWVDAPGDRAWSSPDPGDVLRSLDRFHAIPSGSARAGSWAEWLYFNGRAAGARFYLTFLVGPKRPAGRRIAGVRLQLQQGGRSAAYADVAEIDEAALLAGAPDLTIGKSGVRLRGLRYEVHVELQAEPPEKGSLSGDLYIDAVPGRALPPITIRGAGGWLSGYVVPVMSGALGGRLSANGEPIPLEGGDAYHDHNWGFWEGVSWRWGQVQHEGLSFIYGRLHPPADATDPDRVPGFLAALGPDGPLGYATNVSIEETNHAATGRPRRIVVHGRGNSLNLTLDLAIEDSIASRIRGPLFASGMDFLQLRAQYRVAGRVGSRAVDFTAAGVAETFRPR